MPGEGMGSGPGWWLTVCPAAGEAGGSFRYSLPKPYVPRQGPASDPDRAKAEAARRARGQVRKYCAGNRLNKLGTLTYEGEGCHDPRVFRADVARFFRKLRARLGGQAIPYLWVPEWHPKGHGLHAHFAVARYIHKSHIRSAWGHGFIHIKLLGDLRAGSGVLDEARHAAGYLGKYVSKTFDAAHTDGLHRYEVAQGFHPLKERIYGRSREEVLDLASQRFGCLPERVWTSEQVPDWKAPPAVWAQWPG